MKKYNLFILLLVGLILMLVHYAPAQSTTVTVQKMYGTPDYTTYQINSYPSQRTHTSNTPTTVTTKVTNSWRNVYVSEESSGVEYERDLKKILTRYENFTTIGTDMIISNWMYENKVINRLVSQFATKYGYPKEEKLRKIYSRYYLGHIFNDDPDNIY